MKRRKSRRSNEHRRHNHEQKQRRNQIRHRGAAERLRRAFFVPQARSEAIRLASVKRLKPGPN
jgi:hypothetical protein